MRIIEKTFDAITGEETINERDETADEKAHRLQLEKIVLDNLEAKTKAEIARNAAITKLEQLGLTTDDLQALGL